VFAFLFTFGAINLLTPVVLLSSDRSAKTFDSHQRAMLRNMVRTGICVMFIGLIMLVG
jgi:hypothetical protein